MHMTNDEIVRSYKEAKDPQKQIGILADLNLCKKSEIETILGIKNFKQNEINNMVSEAIEKLKSENQKITIKNIMNATGVSQYHITKTEAYHNAKEKGLVKIRSVAKPRSSNININKTNNSEIQSEQVPNTETKTDSSEDQKETTIETATVSCNDYEDCKPEDFMDDFGDYFLGDFDNIVKKIIVIGTVTLVAVGSIAGIAVSRICKKRKANKS